MDQSPANNNTPAGPRRAIRDVYHQHRLTLCLVLLALLVIVLFYQFRNRQTKPDVTATVVVAPVQNKNVPVYINALGNVVATATITVKTQINGLLMKVHFREGQLVKQGDPLADIDDRPYLAQLTQYEGQLLRDKALLANALIDLKRYQRLWKQDSVSQQILATQQSLVEQYQGAIEIDKGLIASTRVNLAWCHIKAPVDGRLGLRLVDEGNLVQSADLTGLVVITSLSPITVIFTVPEDDVPRLLPQVLAHRSIAVQAWDRQQTHLLATGRLLTMDNQIDTTTGTVRLRAEFDNKNNKLFPNQFVNITVLAERFPNAATIPTAAIQHGSKGDFVFRLNPDSTVSTQAVSTGWSGQDMTIIEHGLRSGQQVVVEGADRLSNGSKVRVA